MTGVVPLATIEKSPVERNRECESGCGIGFQPMRVNYEHEFASRLSGRAGLGITTMSMIRSGVNITGTEARWIGRSVGRW